MKLNLPRTPSYSSKPRERFAHHRLSSRANGRRVFQATQKCTNCESKNSFESKRSFADRRGKVDAFINDPLCFQSLKPESMQSFVDAFPRFADPREVRKVRDDLPVYIFSGGDDPVGQQLAGVRTLIDRYRSAVSRQLLTISIQAAGTKCCTKQIAAM
jgi:alpha-beta hydrolase superfamily lysophospholipase